MKPISTLTTTQERPYGKRLAMNKTDQQVSDDFERLFSAVSYHGKPPDWYRYSDGKVFSTEELMKEYPGVGPAKSKRSA